MQQSLTGLVRGRGVRTTTPAKADARRAADLLNRRFTAAAPNLAWVTDFT
jgi:transposase InsO family protein